MPPSTAVAPQQQTQLSVPARVIQGVEGTATFDALLPTSYRPMAERFKARAKLYISRKPELQQCSVASLVQCVLSAAQDGLCLDGRMAHAVVFNCKKKDPQTGRETWVKEATYMPDYKGIVDSCRRHGAIVDAIAEHVYSNDVFEFYIENGRYHHRYQRAMGDRGDLLGAFALVLLPGDRFKVEYMSLKELDHVRNKSKAKDSGPWVSDTGEMQKKTVIKRALKLYVTDPDTADMLERDDEAMGYVDDAPQVTAAPAKSLDDHAARKQLANQPAAREPEFSMDEGPTFTEQDDAEADQDAARKEFAKCIMDMPFATTLGEVNKLEARAKELALDDAMTEEAVATAAQATARIKSTRGERSTKTKQEAAPSLLDGNEAPPDVQAAYYAEGH